ncbi:MAG: phosphoenolpyruvate synthase regulatory protein [Piscirickettsiaceae bacterium]|nr:MAG: phosphoenolpyruvate synthase regulatory protein [Piscirickettsiaceae bacterium]
MKNRTIFFVSDRTAITAETLGNSLMTQFEGVERERHVVPFVDTQARAETLVKRINDSYTVNEGRPIVFSTFTNDNLREIVAESDCIFYDLFDDYISRMESDLRQESSHEVGKSHGLIDKSSYESRIRAVNYALEYDDGAKMDRYDQADVILVGVSRTGKTPTSLFLALQYGIFTANFPITDSDLDNCSLPRAIKPHKRKLFGLTISAEQLSRIREERRPGSPYASLRTCQREVSQVEELFHMENIPFLNVTAISIEEIAAQIRLTRDLDEIHF